MENKIIEMLAEFNIENYELSSDDDCKLMATALNQLLSTSDYTRVDASVMPDKDRRYFAISSELEEESVEFFEGRWLVEDISNSSFNDVKYWLELSPTKAEQSNQISAEELKENIRKILRGGIKSRCFDNWTYEATNDILTQFAQSDKQSREGEKYHCDIPKEALAKMVIYAAKTAGIEPTPTKTEQKLYYPSTPDKCAKNCNGPDCEGCDDFKPKKPKTEQSNNEEHWRKVYLGMNKSALIDDCLSMREVITSLNDIVKNHIEPTKTEQSAEEWFNISGWAECEDELVIHGVLVKKRMFAMLEQFAQSQSETKEENRYNDVSLFLAKFIKADKYTDDDEIQKYIEIRSEIYQKYRIKKGFSEASVIANSEVIKKILNQFTQPKPRDEFVTHKKSEKELLLPLPKKKRDEDL